MQRVTAPPAPWCRPARPVTRAGRRRLVVALYAAYAAFLVVLSTGYSATPRWPWGLAALALLAFLATGALLVRLAVAPGYVADTADRFLDERQRLVRDRAYRVAYAVVTGL